MNDLAKKKIIAVISSHEADWGELQKRGGEANAFSINSSGVIVPIKTIQNHSYDDKCKILWIPEVDTKWKTIVQILQRSFDNIYIATHKRCESRGEYHVEIKLPKISFSHDGNDPIWRDILEPLLNSALEGNGKQFLERLRVAYEKFEDKITNAHVLRYYILSPLVALDLLVQSKVSSGDLFDSVIKEFANFGEEENADLGCNVKTIKDLCNVCEKGGNDIFMIINEFKELCKEAKQCNTRGDEFRSALFSFAKRLEEMIEGLNSLIGEFNG